MDLTFSAEDFELLKTVLERYVSNLRMEIADTDNLDWRKSMHADEDRAKAILARLEGATPGAAGSGRLEILFEGFVLAV
jgi:hypothetical protein